MLNVELPSMFCLDPFSVRLLLLRFLIGFEFIDLCLTCAVRVSVACGNSRHPRGQQVGHVFEAQGSVHG